MIPHRQMSVAFSFFRSSMAVIVNPTIIHVMYGIAFGCVMWYAVAQPSANAIAAAIMKKFAYFFYSIHFMTLICGLLRNVSISTCPIIACAV